MSGIVLAQLFQPAYTRFFSRWVMTLLVDVDLFIFPCLLTATKISTFLFWSAKRGFQGRKVEIFLHNISLHPVTYSKREETID